MSMSPVLDNLTHLKTRFLYKVIESMPSQDSRFTIGLNNDCLQEIFFWKNNIVRLNSTAILPYKAPLLITYWDASSVACGTYVVGTNEVSHRMWSVREVAKSFTWRELKAIHFALISFKPQCLKWRSDNQGAVLMPQQVPRELNVSADAISNIVHYDDQFTTRWFFYGFANATHTHLPRFNSRFCVPGAGALDTFSVSWKGENNWLVPPAHYIIRVIQHLFVCGAVGILVAPYWPSNAF